MTPNETLAAARAMCAKSAGLRRDIQAEWNEVAHAIVEANPKLDRIHLMPIYERARLGMMTAIVEGRRADAKADGLRSAGLLEVEA